MSITVEALVQQFGGEVRGDRTLAICGAESISKAGPDEITFVMDESNIRQLKDCRAKAVIIAKSLVSLLDELVNEDDVSCAAMIVVDDPQATFIEVLQHFRPERPRPEIGISSQATIASSSRIGTETNIYPGAYISEDVVIGDGCDVFPGVYIGPGCQLGDNVTLFPNAVVYPDVIIGSRVMIHASAVIGADGFGYRFENGGYIKIPHLGTVHIEDDVEIGACTTIDRGMIGPTIIGTGTKIDNLVMVAHNCEVGQHNAFASQVGLAGSVTTGDYVRCAGQVGIADHVHLGEGCTLGACSGAHKSIPEGKTYLGSPARPEAEQIRILMAETRLPHMRKKLQQLVADVSRLNERLDGLSETESEAAA